jgi:hypothetical protein
MVIARNVIWLRVFPLRVGAGEKYRSSRWAALPRPQRA